MVRVLTRAVGFDRRVAFEQGTALAMPFADARLDIAYRISASINITAVGFATNMASRMDCPGKRLYLDWV